MRTRSGGQGSGMGERVTTREQHMTALGGGGGVGGVAAIGLFLILIVIYTCSNIRRAEHTHARNQLYAGFCFVLFLTLPCGLRDLSSPTRDRTQVPAGKALCPNHWTTGNSLHADFKKKLIFFFIKSRQAGLWSIYTRYELAPSQNAAG